MGRHNEGRDFMVGAMIGSTLGALTAMMLGSKKGHKLQRELIGKYHELEGYVKGYASSKKRAMKKTIHLLSTGINKKIRAHKKKIVRRHKRAHKHKR